MLGHLHSLTLEGLESRRLLSITLEGDILRLTGTDGNDQITLTRSGGDDVLATVNGESRLFDLDDISQVFLRGEAGDDFLRPAASGLTARGIFIQTNGGPGADRIEGGDNDEFIFGDGGNDSIFGNAGDDDIHGGDGNDRIEAGTGDDIVYGDGGNDTLLGGAGFDIGVGGGGGGITDGIELGTSAALQPGLTFNHDRNLVFRGGDSPDVVSAVRGSGSGANDLWVSVNGEMLGLAGFAGPGGVTGFKFSGNGGDDQLRLGTQLPLPATVDGGAGDDLLVGGARGDRLVGGDGDDTFTGNAGNDVIIGGNGNDSANGGDGNDSIYGQNGNDELFGQGGNDQLFANDNARDTVDGGTGDDTATVDSLDVLTGVETP